MTKQDTIQILAILGGLGAVISSFISLVFARSLNVLYWLPSLYYSYILDIELFFLSLLTGIIACLMTFHATGYIFKMPQRATSDLKVAGILVITVGIISLLNLLIIVSGILIFIAGTECDDVWKKIQRARAQTGWPFATVTTATGSSWARRTSCRFCGAPLVILTATSRGHTVTFRAQCPLDRTHDTLRLPLSQLDEWVTIIADRLHRCEQCGDRTAALIVISQTEFLSLLQAYCPSGHHNQTYRKIWTPLYPHVARTPPSDIKFQSNQIQPRFRAAATIQRIDRITQPIIISSSPQLVSRPRLIRYCSQCGVQIEANDNFCFRCGNQIR